jgi:hypothetical protein
MKRGRWIAATMALAIGLSAGAFADSHPREQKRDGQATYSRRDRGDRSQAWNNGYYDNGYRDNDDYRGGNWYSRDRDRQVRSHDRDGDRDRDHDGRDRRDRRDRDPR